MSANRLIPAVCVADNTHCSTWSAMSLFLFEWFFFFFPTVHKDPQRFCIWAPSGASWLHVARSQCPSPLCKSSSRSRHHHVPALAHGCALTRVDDKLFGTFIRVPNRLSVQTEAWSYVFNVWPNFTPSLRRDKHKRRNMGEQASSSLCFYYTIPASRGQRSLSLCGLMLGSTGSPNPLQAEHTLSISPIRSTLI